MKKIALIVVLCGCFDAAAQHENFWSILAEVSFETTRDNNGYAVERPLFSRYLKTFAGKKIRLKGYVIPFGETGDARFMLSSMPFNLCYFCGAAGPETVVEVETSEEIAFTSRPIVLEGILLLNADDPDHHIYVLKSSSIVP